MADDKPKSLVERWGAIALAISAILALVFLLFPDLKPRATAGTQTTPSYDPRQAISDRTAPAPVSQRQPVQDGEDDILGTWDQYTHLTDADLRHGGTFVVSRIAGRYVMSAQNQLETSIPTIGLSDVQWDGRRWTFRSNWGGGRVAAFSLMRVSENVFEGVAALGGSVVQRDRWVRQSRP